MRGLFIGLSTLDVIQSVRDYPLSNQKTTALRTNICAGGPATNAAITFAYLGGKASLISGWGASSCSAIAKADISRFGVVMEDVAAPEFQLPVATVVVTEGTGDRSVISGARGKPGEHDLGLLVDDYDVLLVDGHYLEMALPIVHAAAQKGKPVILDAGSWKPGLESLLPMVQYAICSEDFVVPGKDSKEDSARYLIDLGVEYIAITQGSSPILAWSGDVYFEVEVERGRVVDTLGAGDVFHGSFCFYIAKADAEFRWALQGAARLATLSCEYVGTRSWMEDPKARGYIQ